MSASPRHAGRHCAPRRRRFKPLTVAAPAAAVATVAVVGVGVAVSGSATVTAADSAATALSAASRVSAAGAANSVSATATSSAEVAPADVASGLIAKRKATLSRSISRRNAAEAANTAVSRWTTTALNVWSSSSKAATQVGEIASAAKVRATGRTVNGRDEVVVDGVSRWVSAGYLAQEKPDPLISHAPCDDLGVEQGLKPQTITLYRSVCHAFPEVVSYGGWASRVEHNTGNAIDVMVPGNKALGDKIAAWAQKNATALDLYDILWWHRIWTPVRSSEGWRTFADRGGATANHMDHVHLGTN